MARPYIPNAWPALGTTYYVAQSHPGASDTNPGAAERPFKTITAAAAVARAYDRVIIDEGVYREQVPVLHEGERNITISWIIYAAAPGKQVYLKGSDEFYPDWREMEPRIYGAALPESLFEEGVYNPYALPCTPAHRPVNYEFDRGAFDPGPTRAPQLIRPTVGQIYVDHEPLEQCDLDNVRQTPGSFVVSDDGIHIICHFADGKAPHDKLVELTVRERCFKPTFTPHWAGLHIQTLGIVAEHAADPGAFSRSRPLMIRSNPRSGITVRKTPHAQCSVSGCYLPRTNLSYINKTDPTIVSHILDGAKPLQPADMPTLTVRSDDGGKTWQTIDDGPFTDPIANHFLDEDNGRLIRHYRAKTGGAVYNDKAESTPDDQQLIMQVSPDAGRTWGQPEALAFAKDIVCFTLMKLHNGQLLWMVEENRPHLSPIADTKPDAIYFVCRAWLGTWRADLSGVDWEPGGLMQTPQNMGSQGLGEPQACQLPDGRLFAIFRQSIVLPSQDAPGYPSVKLFSVSEDSGHTWSDAQPLTFDDGKYLYSPTSFASAVCSTKNGRVYIITNILNRPNEGCLPRCVVHIAEVDPDTFCVKRDTVTVVEELHEEHTHLVGYSNWMLFEDRDTKNVNLFMNLENGPVNEGYDWNSHRYEIALPG